jgi:hydroxymethylpyrimidine pyrophosphatase-like HAD family hydrolase
MVAEPTWKRQGFESIVKYYEHLAKKKGFKSRAEYQEHLVKKKGFESTTKYHEHLAKKKGFESSAEYQEHLAKDRGFASHYQYREHLAKEKGFGSYFEYREHLAKEKGFESYAKYQEHLAKVPSERCIVTSKEKQKEIFHKIIGKDIDIKNAEELLLPLKGDRHIMTHVFDQDNDIHMKIYAIYPEVYIHCESIVSKKPRSDTKYELDAHYI